MDRKVRMSASLVILQFSGVSVRRRNYSDISLCKQENKEERSSSLRNGCPTSCPSRYLFLDFSPFLVADILSFPNQFNPGYFSMQLV